MQKRLYVVYDKIAEESSQIMDVKNESIAIRHFKGMLANNTPHSTNDYQLIYLGTFDTETLELISNGKGSQVEINFNETGEKPNE